LKPEDKLDAIMVKASVETLLNPYEGLKRENTFGKA